TGSHRDLMGGELQAVVTAELVLDGSLELRRAVQHGVVRVTPRHGLLRGLLDMHVRIEVRLAQAEHDHGLALALELVGSLADAHDVRDTDGADAVGRAESGRWGRWGRCGRDGGVHCWYVSRGLSLGA